MTNIKGSVTMGKINKINNKSRDFTDGARIAQSSHLSHRITIKNTRTKGKK